MSSSLLQRSGGFRWRVRDPRWEPELSALLEDLPRPLGIHAGFRPFGDVEVYFKAEPLTGWPRQRHRMRRLALGRPYPRLAEFENLEWLAARDFQVPRPLAAGVRTAWNGIAWQFLVTERVAGCRPLVDAYRESPELVLRELCGEVVRMHDAGFVHRDLHLRNLAWLPRTPGSPIVFFDAWRGGARWQSRGVDYDEDCLARGLSLELGESAGSDFRRSYAELRQREHSRSQ